jgi:asparagine synthase (glutamine-hydrolysing)
MSGQAGIYYYDHRPIDRSLADRLGAGLHRQGPDGGSEHLGEGLLMVYRAFTFDPLSRQERQPYCSPGGNWSTFDGRLDNRDDLLLLVKDHLQDDTTDVALAMAAYEKWGESGFNRLIGDWSLALWEASSKSIILASDYLGVRPLYYYADANRIAWSSDLNLLVSWFGVEDDLDHHYIAAFLTWSPSYDRTIYRTISFVPCAHSLRARERNLSKTPFWHPPIGSCIRYKTDSDYEENLMHHFRVAVLSRLRTDQGVCSDLSGGLDSSSVTCMVHHLMQTGAAPPKQLVTFSLMDPDMDDERYTEIVEQYCQSAAIHVPFSQLWSLDAPSSPMPIRSDLLRGDWGEALRSRSIRSHLTGLGGDLVMGNTLDDADQLADALRQGAWIRFLKEAYAWSRATRIPIGSILRTGLIPLLSESRQTKLWAQKSKLQGQAYGHLTKIGILDQRFIDRYLERDLPPYYLEYRRAVPSQRAFLHAIAGYQVTRPLTVRQQQFEPVRSTHPYCHRPLVEFVAAIPRSQLCAPGRPRSLMRRAFAGLLPPAVRERRSKALVGSATDKSILEILPALSRESLQVESRGYLDRGNFQRVVQNPQSTDYDREHLMQTLTLELWFRTRAASRQSYAAERQFRPATAAEKELVELAMKGGDSKWNIRSPN